MTVLRLVRHGRAAAGFADHVDPGLAREGRAQAEAVAERLAPLGPMPVLTSPLRRAAETAQPLAQRWGIEPTEVAAVGEIPSPTDDLAGRATWLRTALESRWSQLGATQRRWRDEMLHTLAATTADSVVFTHFVAINAVVGAATGDDRAVIFRPDYTSCTVVEVRDGGWRVVEQGAEAATIVR